MPLKFKKLLSVPNKISQVLLLGNCTKSHSFLKFVNQISSNVVIVRGEFDNGTIATTKTTTRDIPITTIIKQGNFRIGCCNGYTLVPKNDPLSLLTLSRQLDVDILLWGGTHNVEAYTLEGKFFINPGSCTGAFNADWPIQDELDTQEQLNINDEVLESADFKEPTAESDVGNKENEPNVEEANEKSENLAKNVESKEHKSLSEDDGETDSTDEEEDEIDINGGNIPSFCLLDIQGSTCTLYIYTYADGEVKVDKVVYKKEQV